MAPFVSVIVPVLNGEETIRDCLASLLRMKYPAERREPSTRGVGHPL